MKFYTSAHLYKGKILTRGIDSKGQRFSLKAPCRPYLFTVDAEGKYETLEGLKVSKKNFSSTFDARKYVEDYGDVAGLNIYGSTAHLYPHLNQEFPGELKFDQDKINVANIDIEVSTDGGYPNVALADKEIISIVCKYRDIYHVFGLVDYKNHRDDIRYMRFNSEADLLNSFLEFWSSRSIDVVTGWFIDMFDIPYIVARVEKVLGPGSSVLLSPWGVIEKRVVFMNGRDNDTYTILGISVIDYMRAYKKFTYTERDSYKLDYIGEVELKDKKLDYSEYGTLNEFYKQNPQKFIEYNIKDVEIVSRLDEKLQLLNLIYTIAYLCKVTYEDAFGTVKIWECLIHNFLLEKNIVVKPRTEATKAHFVGGFVKEPITGRHDWIVSFDYDSLYPHIMMAYNISPETIVEKLSKNISVDGIIDGQLDDLKEEIGNNAVTASGWLYSKEKRGFFPEIMSILYVKRSQSKKAMLAAESKLQKCSSSEKKSIEAEVATLNGLQKSLKYVLNGGYGAMSNEYFLWFDMRPSESITMSGQLAIKWLAKDVNLFLNKAFSTSDYDYIVAIDTDSLYVRLGELFKNKLSLTTDEQADMVDQLCNKSLLPIMKKSIVKLCEETNVYENKLNIKRETIAKSAIWTAKKKYALLALDVEGVRFAEPKVKAIGLEMIRTSTPASCREKLGDAMKIALSGTELEMQSFVKKFKVDFSELRFDQVAFPRGVNDIEKYYDSINDIVRSGAPQNVKAAVAYNRRIDEFKLNNKHKKITSGDKIKFCYMKMPNPINSEILGSTGELPEELKMNAYIDYNTQFEKSFIKPLRLVIDTIGWQPYKKPTLSSFFKQD